MNPQPRTVGFKAGERNVFFHILTACNLRCQHCYINTSQHGTEILETERVKKWLKLFHNPEMTSNVIFLGGEPTLHPGLAECVAAAKELSYTVTVDTNGFNHNDFINKTSPDKVDYLSFSLDGPDSKINDPIRGAGVFDVCTANIRKAVAAGFNVSLIYTVSKRNIDQLADMVSLLNNLGIKRFFIQVIGLRGEASVNHCQSDSGSEVAWQVGRREWLEVVPRVAANAASHGIHVTYPKVFLDDDEKFECAGVVAENYFIFPNGRVYQCPLCEDYPLHTYSIEKESLSLNPGITEKQLFTLSIKEGCVMNKLLQPQNIEYGRNGMVKYQISCCLLKNEIGNSEEG